MVATRKGSARGNRALLLCLAVGGGPAAQAQPPPTGKAGASGTRADAHYVTWDGRLALVVICDFSGSDRAGSAGSDGRFSGHSATAGRRVEWRWDTRDGKGGTVVINGQEFDRADGGLFLVDTRGKKPRVVQRKPDFGGDDKALDKLATTDPEVKQFVAKAAEPR